jgi:ABC-type thiamin/hydroxymethylpyrimidine transport system permease subunit
MPPKTASASTSHWLWPLLLLLGCATALIAWLLVALSLGQQAGWMAIGVALESAFMLRLGTFRPGTARALTAVAATVVVIVAAQWAIASAQMGLVMGLDVLASSLRMGPRLAWLLSAMANSPFDLACWAVGLAVAWLAAK